VHGRVAPADHPSPTAQAARISSDAKLGTVRLTVSDLTRARAFYEGVLGLQGRELDGGTVAFGVGEGTPLIELSGDPAAPRPNRRTTGLYHLAILFPTRLDLASALGRVAAARWPLHGASDHLVSEALYLADPDGNGVELYRDRPREQWPRSNGQLEMATLPLDLGDLLAEHAQTDAVQRAAPGGTRIGHVHLQVSELEQSEEFYSGILGFEVMVRGYPGALFVSTGGYHHHVGMNTWQSAGASPPPPGSVGLRDFEVLLPSDDELGQALERVGTAGIELEQHDRGTLIRDPSGNGVVLRGG
jgi:catechol 2,3-dioxygenase